MIASKRPNDFNPLPLYRGRRPGGPQTPRDHDISILSLYTEGDRGFAGIGTIEISFQSSPSIQRETPEAGKLHPGDGISILSLYTEGDSSGRSILAATTNFNPLPLYRGRPTSLCCFPDSFIFQSSPSIQRETPRLSAVFPTVLYFNPLPLYRGRLLAVIAFLASQKFQSSPSIQRETPAPPECSRSRSFQSSPSIQRETRLRPLYVGDVPISILSLYTEGDPGVPGPRDDHRDFNPLPLYRGRLKIRPAPSMTSLFQSSPSIQRETGNGTRGHYARKFQSSPSIQRETCSRPSSFAGKPISILSLYTEGDVFAPAFAEGFEISILSLYTEGDAITVWGGDNMKNFNPLPLYRGRPAITSGSSRPS